MYLNFIGSVVFSITLILMQGCSATHSKEDTKGEPTVVMYLISPNDEWGGKADAPNLLMLDSDGKFQAADGRLVKEKSLSGYFKQDKKDQGKRPVYLLLEIVDEKGFSLPALVSGLNKLRKSVPKGTKAVIYVSVNSLVPAKRLSK